ncbi:MAG: glycerate kinase [Lachnospiraceae bacterium]|nr:glycerate kinase [Lachnospiraceae bacterium]
MEMAQASGLTLLPLNKRNPLLTTSRGTGEVLRHVLDMGFTDITLAIGGSATNDGGMGFASALGIRFLDDGDRELPGRGIDLERVKRIDISGLDPRIRDTKLTVMCDVSNPLCGVEGATYTYGTQKGADADMLKRLESGMCSYRDVIRETFSVDPDTIPGSGAAGGLGAALAVFFGVCMKPGIEAVLDLAGFDQMLDGVDLVVTGEGRADWQSCYGKVMHGIGMRAKAKGIPVAGLCGSLGDGALQLLDHGISSLMATVDRPMELHEAMERAEELYYNAALQMFRLLRAGKEMS